MQAYVLALAASFFLFCSLLHMDGWVENDVSRYMNDHSRQQSPHGEQEKERQQDGGNKEIRRDDGNDKSGLPDLSWKKSPVKNKEAPFGPSSTNQVMWGYEEAVIQKQGEKADGALDLPLPPDKIEPSSDAAKAAPKAKGRPAGAAAATTTKPPPVPTFDQPYWNLTCPLELSMFSGAHIGGNRVHAAWASREIAERAVVYFATKNDWSALEGRRIFFVGDSLMRQTFISMACLAWHRVEDYVIPWFHRRAVRDGQPNSIGSGPHSKFEEGRVLLRGGTELIYHHGIGGLLELGEENNRQSSSHEEDQDSWIKACFLKKSFTAMVPKYVDWSHANSSPSSASSTDGTKDARASVTSTNVRRERLALNSKDIVLINASVHGTRSFNLKNIVDLFDCHKRNTRKDTEVRNNNDRTGGRRQQQDLLMRWPHFLYMVTGARHFPTPTGAFEKRLLTVEEDFECIAESTDREWQEEETTVLGEYLTLFVGAEMLPLQYKSGNMHVGGKDCLHWMQPGIPDLLAVDLLQHTTTTLEIEEITMLV
jgi:hypothetical protein